MASIEKHSQFHRSLLDKLASLVSFNSLLHIFSSLIERQIESRNCEIKLKVEVGLEILHALKLYADHAGCEGPFHAENQWNCGLLVRSLFPEGGGHLVLTIWFSCGTDVQLSGPSILTRLLAERSRADDCRIWCGQAARSGCQSLKLRGICNRRSHMRSLRFLERDSSASSCFNHF